MSGFHAKRFLRSTLLTGSLLACLPATLPVLAQTTAPTDTASPRAASFMPMGSPASGGYSGLAIAAPVSAPPALPETAPVISVPALAVPALPASMPSGVSPSLPPPPIQFATPSTADTQPKTVATPLPAVSPETIGTKSADQKNNGGLGADMWKGTPRNTADILLANAAPTQSSILNNLLRRLLITAATPPEGDSNSLQSLTAIRIARLVGLGDSQAAWNLVQSADPKSLDDTSLHLVAENMLPSSTDICPQAINLTSGRINADWQKLIITCALRAKDTKGAQISLDVMRSQSERDTVFIDIADKTLLGETKKLPSQLTPMTAPALALLQIAQLPIPGSLYSRPDNALIPALLRLPAQQDVARLALAEKAIARGLITLDEIAAIYRSIGFTPEMIAAVATSTESGLRLHALLFRAAEKEQDPVRRIGYALKFMQSASPFLLNNAGGIAAQILGSVKPDPAQSANAPDIAALYMMADRPEALDWYRLAQSDPQNSGKLLALWPQFALAGIAAEGDFDKWLSSATTPDSHDARDNAASVLLLLDAAGYRVPDNAWGKVMESPIMEKKIALSPLVFDRLQNAGANNRRAETILLAVNVAGGDMISVPKAVGITRALRFAGFKTEATLFARQSIATLGLKN